MQRLEDQRHAFAEDVGLLLERLGDLDRPDLAARDRRFGRVLGDPERSLDSACARPRHVAGDAGDERVVVRLDDDAVGPRDAEIGVDARDFLAEREGRSGCQGKCETDAEERLGEEAFHF